MATTSIPFNKSAQSTPQQFKSNVNNVDPSVDPSDKPRDALVHMVPFAIIAGALFPSVSPTQAGEVLQMLQTKGKINSKGWTAFEALCSSKKKNACAYEPLHSSEAVEVTFKALEQVFEAIGESHTSLRKGPIDDLSLGSTNDVEPSLESVEGNQDSLTTLSIYGNGSLAGEWPDRTTPDGSIHLKETCLPWHRVTKVDPKENAHVLVDCADVCLLIEAKLRVSQGDVDDNCSKLLCNAHHKLRSDPRCRFVTGITVENTQMQLWYFDRAGILVSESFDFMREPHKLIRIFLGYIIAPSEGALGFDPTIRCTGVVAEYSKVVPKPNEDGARVYDIGIHDSSAGVTTVFRTIRCLVNFGATGICGRGTRVWEVVKVDTADSERTYVLKDVWIDEDEDPTTEGTRLRHIHDHASPEELQFFLEVDCHGVVPTNDLGSGHEDKTFKYPNSATADLRTMLIQYAAPAPRLATSTNMSIDSGTTASTRTMAHSSQSSDLGASTGIKECFTTTSNGSYMMTDEHPHTPRAGPARRRHYRIAFTDSPGCPIRDLTTPRDAFEALHGGLKAMKAMLRQYLMHKDISAGNILLIKRGTEKVGVLMDLEYAKEFPGDSSTPHAVRTGTKQFMAVEVLNLTYLFQPMDKEFELGWSHNPLHDVESTWWITVWILYYRAEISLSDDEKRHRAKLFSIADTHARSIFFQYKSTGKGFKQKLPVAIRKILDDWRIALLMFYQEQQADLEHGSHKSFNYDNVITDAIGRIESIVIELPADATVTPSLPSQSIIDDLQNSRGRSFS